MRQIFYFLYKIYYSLCQQCKHFKSIRHTPENHKIYTPIFLIFYNINPAEYLDDPLVDDTPLDLDSENNKTVTIRSKSRHLNEDTIYQEANSTVAANETVLASPLQSLSPLVSYSRDTRSFSSLFRTFSFKGIGYCFTKSVVEWQTVGLGKARIPF